jgi:23S rRNA (uracil1939-C5)-methyltransferase
MELVLEKWVPGGDCIARKDGKVIFVEGGIPGEKVLVTLTVNKKDFSKAKVVKVLEKSEHRVSPKCRHYSECGGCNLQHISYEHQLFLKEKMLVETLARMGGIELNKSISMFSSRPWGYRNRVRFHQHGKFKGFKEAQRNRIVPIQECPVLTPKNLSALKKYQGKAKEVSLFDNNNSVYIEGEYKVEILNKVFYLNNKTFFQSNLKPLPELVNWAVAGENGKLAVDLFSGVGFFASFLEDHFDRVIAVERNDKCLPFAKRNLSKTEFYTGAVEEWQLPHQIDAIDFLLVDPPREGLEKSVPELLAKWQIPKLVYISCNPVTLARDLKKLIALGYGLESTAAFDLYPQTQHLEVGVKLTWT